MVSQRRTKKSAAIKNRTFKNSVFKSSAVTIRQTEKQQASAAASGYGIDEVRTLAEVFGISELQLIKPGIGETTRVLLRRVPWKVLIDARYRNNPELGHIVRLAEEKQVPIEFYPLRHYKCCGIIKKLAEA